MDERIGLSVTCGGDVFMYLCLGLGLTVCMFIDHLLTCLTLVVYLYIEYDLI